MQTTGTISPEDRDHETWTAVAEAWRRHDHRFASSMTAVTERMLAAAGVGPGHHVLDIATGIGEPAIPAAERVGPTGRVLATDFVEPMLDYARRKASARGLRNIEFRRMDAANLDVPGGTFDAYLCRFALMLMPDPAACLKAAHGALRTGGRIAVATWAAPNRNPWASGPLSVIRRYVELPPPPPGAPGLFALSDPSRLHRAFVSAGFQDTRVEEVEVVMGGPFEDGDEFTDFIVDLAGPIAQLLREMEPDLQTTVREEIARDADARRRNGKVAIPAVALVAHAHR